MTETDEEYDDRDINKLPFFANPTTSQTPQRPWMSGAPDHLLSAAGGRRAQTPDVATTSEATPGSPSAVDWDVIAQFRDQVSSLLTASLESTPGMTEAQQQAVAQAHITDVIRSHIEDIVRHSGGDAAWGQATQQAAAKAVFDSLFKLGRIQPLIDEAEVENIDITGYDNVYVTYANGEVKKHEPIAESDADLIAEIAFLAARGGEAGRAFTATNPILDMDLPGGARLAAVAPPINPRPKIVIRVHRFVDITLADMVEKRTISTPAEEFLTAAIRAGKSVVVTGHPGAGKTTLTRALASALDPLEKIVTIEKERELYLDRMGDRHLIVTALQYRQGQGERTPDGSRPGEVTLVELLEEALRLDAQRIFVGEVRGGEIDAMFQAMQAGVGSLSTLHASSPTNAIERMATLTQKSLNTSDAYAYRQIAQHIDLIIHVSKFYDRTEKRMRRFVTEIAEVQAGETSAGVARPVAAPIFQADRRSRELIPVGLPTPAFQEDLIHEGFNPDNLLHRTGQGAA